MTRRACRSLFLVALLTVALASLLPEGTVGAIPRPWDKVAHFGAWFLLAALAALGWPRWRGLALVGLPLAGLTMEAAQALTPAREFSWADALANAAGVGVAVTATAALTSWLDRG